MKGVNLNRTIVYSQDLNLILPYISKIKISCRFSYRLKHAKNYYMLHKEDVGKFAKILAKNKKSIK